MFRKQVINVLQHLLGAVMVVCVTLLCKSVKYLCYAALDKLQINEQNVNKQ